MSDHPSPGNDDLKADTAFDGGDMDCGSGLLLLIRRHIDPLPRGGLLQIDSTEPTVEIDLPAWCRMTGNELVRVQRHESDKKRSFLVCKGSLSERTQRSVSKPRAAPSADLQTTSTVTTLGEGSLPDPVEAAPIQPLSVMGIGSWPRPRWLLHAIHEHISGRLDDQSFAAAANDAVRLCVAAQLRAGVDIVTDGEQRRDSYSSFVGGILDNCQLVPITDLLAYVDDPDKFAQELQALDVPAAEVRHPAVFGRLGRSRPLTLGELRFLRQITEKPIKIALPGPYLLTRTMWLECISDRVYQTREELADDVVRVLRAELFDLLAAGASLVQFDEPVLSEVVFGAAAGQRSFMCGALSGKRDPHEELAFAADLLNRVIADAPRPRTGLHMCRGNWSRNEELALQGGYEPLLETLQSVRVGTYFLELCTPRAGEWEVLRQLPADARIGVGMLNPKSDDVETVSDLTKSIERAVALFGFDRVLLNPDCGFATFADNPVNSAEIAEAKLTNLCRAAAFVKTSGMKNT